MNATKSLQAAILTVSDRASQGVYEDVTSPALSNLLYDKLNFHVVSTKIVPDEKEEISNCLKTWVDTGDIDLILTTGGTGCAPRDVTPEATLAVIDKQTPGLVEAMRSEAMKITPHAMLSRAVAGIRHRTLIINLPGSPKGAVENLGFIITAIPHAIALLKDQSTEAGHHHAQDTRQ